MQLRVSDLLNELHERTDLVEDRIEGIENKINLIHKTIEALPEQIAASLASKLTQKSENHITS